MITTFSGAAVRSEISDAGKFSLAQYQRPSPAWRTWPSSARNASRSSAGRRPEHLARLERQLERRGPQVGEQDVEVVRVEAGLLRRALEQELRVVDDVLVDRRAARRRGPRRSFPGAARPARTAATSPRPSPDSRPGSTRRAGRCRRRARARSWRRRRGSRRRAGRARSRAAPSAGSRRGSRGPGCAARSSRAATRAARSAGSRPRRASGRRRSSGARPAGTAAPSAGRASRPSRGRRSPGRGSAGRRGARGARRPARRSGRRGAAGRPVSISASSAGLPMVAEQHTITGWLP